MSRIGKIARLPRHIRTDLNHRLDDGQEGQPLLDWLNGLPLVEQMIEEQFAAVPISPQNLSEWRQGGFREWLFRQELIEQACQADDYADDLNDEIVTSQLAGKLAGLLAARYAALLGRWNGDLTPDMADAICVLRGLNKDIALLQKTLQSAEKQQRDRDRANDEEEKWELEEEKKRATAPMWAKLEAEAMALSFGGGEKAQKIAEYLMAVKHDLPPPPEYRERPASKPETQPAPKDAKNPKTPPSAPVSSKLIKPNQVKTKEERAANDVTDRPDAATKKEVP